MHTAKKRRWLRERDGNRCCYCNVVMSFDPKHLASGYMFAATIEHVKRKADGGLNVNENLKLACMDCNTRRGTLSFEYWRMIRKPGNG